MFEFFYTVLRAKGKVVPWGPLTTSFRAGRQRQAALLHRHHGHLWYSMVSSGGGGRNFSAAAITTEAVAVTKTTRGRDLQNVKAVIIGDGAVGKTAC